jgi:hypothetical protein
VTSNHVVAGANPAGEITSARLKESAISLFYKDVFLARLWCGRKRLALNMSYVFPNIATSWAHYLVDARIFGALSWAVLFRHFESPRL